MKIIKTLLSLAVVFQVSLSGQVSFQTDANTTGTPVSQELIGVFFEDINYAADGGLYAELVQNRSFEYYPVSGYVNLQPLHAWSLVSKGGAVAGMEIQNTMPLNENNTNYLALTIDNAGTEAGISNSGFDGIPVNSGENYKYSVYLKSHTTYLLPVVIRLENSFGQVLGSDTIKDISTVWKKFAGEIICSQSDPTARLVLVTTGTGTLYFDMVSLFPENTFMNRDNGLRSDLAQAIADLQPRFLRFPGGCISHGRGLDNAYRWKETIGDVAERKPNWNLWGYHQTYGLGFYEYFQFCEDIGAMPLPVVPVGVSCQFRGREIAPMDEMGAWIDDALDLVEFANGDLTTEWGLKRADMGHPEPFNMEYICLGNEEDDIPEFRTRFRMIADSLRKYHPEIKIIGTSGTAPSGSYYESLWDFSREENLDAVDEHYYMDPAWFLENVHRYDHFDRNGPKVFIGEYASRDDRLENAIAEASYLTGVEKNSDVVQFTCYAPMLCHEHHNQWHPDLIRFDNTRVVKTANYYVQQLYSLYSGHEHISSTVSYDQGFEDAESVFSGNIGVATWNTRADFDDVKVVSGDQVIIDENFSDGASLWQVIQGTFNVSGGIYSQSSNLEPALSIMNLPVDSSEYTLTLKARKTGGLEGFLIPFGFKDTDNFYWLNIGGWGNTQHAIEKSTNGSKTQLSVKPGSIESNRWYDIKIEVTRNSARCYLDAVLLFEVPAPPGPVTASVVKDTVNNELIVKLVNAGPVSLLANLQIEGIPASQEATLITLSGLPGNRNSLESPSLVVPREISYQVSNDFDYLLAPASFHVFRLRMAASGASAREAEDRSKGDNIRMFPNPSSGQIRMVFDNPLLDAYTLCLFNASGKEILRREGAGDNNEVIQGDRLHPGIYFASVSVRDRVQTGRFVIAGQ